MSQHDVRDTYNRYRTGLTISLAVVFVQALVFALLARGVGLFEDMAHGVADNLVLIGTTIVLYFEAHGATPNKGRKRALALLGGVLLLLAGFGGAWTAFGRITGEQIPLSGWTLAATSLVAVIGGSFAFWIIHGVHESMRDHLHVSAISHLVGDLAISIAVFLSSLGIIFFGWSAIDSWVAGILISPWMVWRGIQILKYEDAPASVGDGDPHHPEAHDDPH